MTDAYAAGLIDGEGCISITPHNKERIFYARVDVGMGLKGLPSLERLKDKIRGQHFGTGRASEQGEKARAWRIYGKPLEAFLIAILPHLLLKREQAEYALKLHRMITSLPRRPNGSAFLDGGGEEKRPDHQGVNFGIERKGPQHGQLAGWFARLVGETWITPQRDLVSAHGWEEFSGTWPRSGYVQNFTAYQLPPLVPLTDATASGSWPTPKSEPSGPDYARATRPDSGGDDLATAVGRLWRTPDANPGNYRLQGNSRQSKSLNAIHGGSLNPTWVEWLMGFPLGWTDLER